MDKSSGVGDIRIKTGFLWFPKKIGKKTKWLDIATWEEQYYYVVCVGGWWESRRWIEL